MTASEKFPAADDKIERDRRGTVPPPNVTVRERRYDFYEAHPEHRPRPLTARQVRRRAIREG
jgi:hypothetical protein